MSRTRRGSKAPGYVYWSRRPGGVYKSPGRISKNITHRAERQEAKKETRNDD